MTPEEAILQSVGFIVGNLSAFKITYADEKQLQDGIAQILDRVFLDFDRERRLSRSDVVDFAIDVGGKLIAIEVKTKGSLAAVTRQLFRYAAHDEVAAIILVSTRFAHSGIPTKILGKPAILVVLPGGLA